MQTQSMGIPLAARVSTRRKRFSRYFFFASANFWQVVFPPLWYSRQALQFPWRGQAHLHGQSGFGLGCFSSFMECFFV